ncbi:MAG TPA: ABC transporter permease [Candidatus Binatia bacterium]|nr:ABC transporter permease [Candidatus Binatia bacterium]
MVVIFVATRAAGDPAILNLPADATQADIDAARQRIGTDRSYITQFEIFLRDMATFEFGRSIVYRESVKDLIGTRLIASLKLQMASLILILLTAFPLGVLAAVKRGKLTDRIVQLLAAFGQAAPGFWVGLVLMAIFAVYLRILPAGGMGSGGLDSWRYYVLPAISTSLLLFAAITRLVRSSMLESLDSEFVKLARAKGVPEWKVVWVHVFRNGLLPVMTFMAIWAGTAVSGSVVTEVVFDWPGIGNLFLSAIISRDFPIIQAVVGLVAVAVLTANLVVDLLYGVVDPRVRFATNTTPRLAARK